MGTLWDPFRCFLEVLGAILGDEKIAEKLVVKRSRGKSGSSRELPEAAGNDPCFPY